jgi:hypothetical protein
VLDEFHKFVKKNGFTFISHLGQIVDDAQIVASKSKYSPTLSKEIETLSKNIETDERGLYAKNSDEISQLLTAEIIGRFDGNSEQIRAGLRYDRQAKVAEGILKDDPLYLRILGLTH